MTDYTHIIEIVVSLLSAIITAFIIPVLKQKLNAEQRDKLSFWVGIAVSAAEQLYGEKTGDQKKEYVMKFLEQKGIKFDEVEVTALIESEVYNLTKSLGELGVTNVSE